MKGIYTLLLFLLVFNSFSQDVLMQNGTFNRCEPDIFYDSGGEFGNYSSNENFVTTICSPNAGEFILLNFTSFSTQLNADILTIYDGDSTAAPLIGTYSGVNNPGTVQASASNTSGCLTIQFVSNATGTTTGWAAEIFCAVPCQTITASIDSTVPAVNGSGVVSILPGDTVDFTGSATFSTDGTGATYSWNFGDTNSATGQSVSNTYTNPGTYTVVLTVTDTNPQGCSDVETITVFVLGANVVIDQTTFTIEELIQDVLINSECAEVTNITFSTGTNFGDENGIGYFLGNGTDFPFQDGIIMTSGDASEARGPNNNAMSAGGFGWPGDADLNAAVGITSNNASIIEFDFVPLADSISFDFLMASEEYNGSTGGTFECTFSDAFAFLLTDANGVTTNLAVLPNTTTPILVTNIHPANAGCPAINEQYFGGYTPQNQPPISFDGRTAVFTAQSPVIPGDTYHIKLVVADATDTALDSGVFLKAGSFDLGGSLGDDVTIAAGTAVCTGDNIILNTNLAGATHTWYKDAVVIPGETTSTLTVTEPGEYAVDIVFSGVCQTSDSIIIEFRSTPVANPAPDINLCDPTATGLGSFELTDNDTFILGAQDPTEFVITYHLSQQDAIDDVGALTSPYNNVTNPQTIYARIEDNTGLCFDTTSFDLALFNLTINPVPDIILCDDSSNDGISSFDLTLQDLGILGSQPSTDFVVSYYTSFADADGGLNALTSPYTNTINPEPIYVRVESIGDSNCYIASAAPVFNLVVNYRAIATPPMTIEVCDDVSNDGVSQFDLTLQDVEILAGQDPAIYIVSYYETQADAEAGTNAIVSPGSYSNTSNPQTIHVRVEDASTPDCYGYTSFDLQVNALPDVIVPTALEVCDDNADGFTPFTLTDKNTELLNGQTGILVTYYETQLDADNATNEIFSPYTNIVVNTQTVYVRLENSTTGCYNTTTLDLVVNALPVPIAPTALEVCDDDNDGFSSFDLTLKDAEVLGGQLGMSVSYHETQADADNGVNALGSPYNNIVPSVQTVYVRLEDDATGCSATVTLTLIVNSLPSVGVAITAYELCDDNNPGDEQESFDLSTKDAEIINGQAGVVISYYETQADADAGVNALGSPYLNTSNPQTIYIRLENTTTGCSETGSFELIVNPLPQYVVPSPLEVCDDNIPDGITAIDLTLKNVEISGNNANYSVTYYGTQLDADTASNALPIPYTGFNGEVVYVRVEDINTGCYATTTLDLVVQQAPIAFTPTPLEYCDPDSDGFGVFTLTDADTEITGGAPGLTVSYHETMADADNNVNALTSPYNNIVVNTQTLYVRVESATIATDCATIVELVLIVNPTPQIEDPSPLEVCDDASGDGFAQFDLTSKDAEILDGLDPVQYIVTYYATQANADAGTNAIVNPGNYTNTTAFNQTLWVRVEDTVNGCYKLTSLELIVNALPVLVQPTSLELCDYNNPGDEMEAFTLTDAADEILNGQTGISLTYYETQLDADNVTNAITSPYTNTVNPQTIYVRATDDITGCVSTITLDLRVNPIPSPAVPTDLEECDEDNDGFASFDLESRTLEIINGELDIVVSYHETMADADNNQNPLVSPYNNIVPNTQTVYARAENTITGCYTVVGLVLNVLPSPEVPLTIEDYVICDTNDDGIAQFDLTTMNPIILGVQSPVDFTLTYHLTQANADSGANPISNVTNYTNITNPQTLYIRLVSIANGCVTTGQFDIRVELPPMAVQPTPLQVCDDEIADEITVFDLTVKDAEITGGNASWSVSYYETNADAQSGTNAVDASSYTNTSVNGAPANPQTLYVVVTDTDTGCTDYTTLTIRVLPNPTPSLDPDAIALCDDINTGDGLEVFDLTVNEIYIINGEVGVTATYHETQEDAEDGTNAIADPTQYTNIPTDYSSQLIYVRVTNDITGCYTIVTFTIQVNPLPDVVAVTDYIICELNNDGAAGFDLTLKDAEVLNGQDPVIYTVSYHSTQQDADDLVNGLVSPYTNTSNPQQIFVAITNTITGCSISTQSFNIEVQEAAQANSDMVPIVYQLCDDNMETDGNPSNDSVQFDLTTQNPLVLDGQDPANYIVSYYETQADAELGVNPLPFLYENLINPQVIYVRVDNDTPDVGGMDTSICYAVASLTLEVLPLPEFDLEDSYILCVGVNGSEVLEIPILDTGLSDADYSFEWSLNGTVLGTETGSSLTPTQGGTYSVLVTTIATGCTNTDSTEVIESAPPIVVAVVSTQAFAENHVIEAEATGLGDYEYSLDNGPWQDSGVFEGVTAGLHVVTARDKIGCGEASTEVMVLDYPHYFTPNGDGYHDTWNIIGFADQPSTKIYIFDRYGKLLKQISPSGAGWDGTYNGNPMPTSDYWFVVEYSEANGAADQNIKKEFKAHFTLKR
jgi:gliding motility-associated-like protein